MPMLVIFLKIVTMGTELCCKLAIPVNSIAQNVIFTGAHCFAVTILNAGYSTQPTILEKLTAKTAITAWKTTRRIFKLPEMR